MVVVTGACSSSASSTQLVGRLGVQHALAGQDDRPLRFEQRPRGAHDVLRVGAGRVVFTGV